MAASSPPPPRWWVQMTAALSFLLGIAVVANEAFVESATTTERPILLALAYALLTGSAITAFLDRFRKP